MAGRVKNAHDGGTTTSEWRTDNFGIQCSREDFQLLELDGTFTLISWYLQSRSNVRVDVTILDDDNYPYDGREADGVTLRQPHRVFFLS